jgi:transcriptional regulator with XRE-family HTH domain
MVGTLVKQRRHHLGLTQVELSRRAGLSQNYISKLEAGQVDLPQRGTLDALGGALDTPIEEFYRAAGILDFPMKNGDDEPPLDIFDRLPLGRIERMLRDLPTLPGQATYEEQLRQLDRLPPSSQDRMLRQLAKDFLWRLRQELEREEGGEK